MTDFFDPDIIRGDIESSITDLFHPGVYSAINAYSQGDRVRINGQVYKANVAVTGVAPPAAQWINEGPVYNIIYENVEGTFAQSGAVRISISWADTRNESVFCPGGTLRAITGVLTVWVFTPLGQGTSAGLKAAMRLRNAYLSWSRLGICGKEVRISSVNGPRHLATPSGVDHYAHAVSATLTAMERVSYLR